MTQQALSTENAINAEEEFIKDKHNNSEMPLKVLVVEDSLSELMRLKAIINKNGYDVISASNGKEALRLLETEEVHLIVSDWRMPEVTGIDLCRKVSQEARYGHPYFILLTGFNTQSDLVAGMDAGADDFISKPVGNEVLRVRLQADDRLLKLRGELEVKNQQMESTHKEIQRDLDAAARMQRELLPDGQSPFPQLEIGMLFLPAVTIAGDGFGYFKLDDEHLAFYHLDEAGHGIASVMLSFTLSHFLSPALADELLCKPRTAADTQYENIATHITPPHHVVATLNQRFQENHECNHYFTMVYGVFNISTGRGSFCQAGHPHPMLVSKEGVVRKLGSGGFPVGMLEQAEYESTAFQLNQGERLFLFPGGITDTTNENGITFGNDRYEHILKSSCKLLLKKTIDGIFTILHRWNGDQNFDDDISLLVFGHK